MLLSQIQEDSLAARKARDTLRATLLVTLYSEASRVGKDDGNRVSTDDEVQSTIRKFVKGLNESLAVVTDEAARAVALQEKALLEAYLPQMATGEVLAQAIADIVAGLPEKNPKQMGAVMAGLKAKFNGAYDGKEASALVKAALL